MKDNDTFYYSGWNVLSVIGRGSSSTVYKISRELSPNKYEYAALKRIVIPNEQDMEDLEQDGYDREGLTETFRRQKDDIIREYDIIQSLRGHTNIVNVFDVDKVQHADGLGWDVLIRMELVTAISKKILQDGMLLSETEVIKMGQDICRALVLCEKNNILHRDIKPQNIFVSENGDYKLGDFGIAKIAERTSSGTKTGTFRYMAPEVYNNKPYGNRSDIYSLGLVMHWLLNERRSPFLPLPPKTVTAEDDNAARMRRFSGEPISEPANGSTGLKRIILKACEFNPADRYMTADEMLKDLNHLMVDRSFVPLFKKSDSEQFDQPEEDSGTFGSYYADDEDQEGTRRARKTKEEQKAEKDDRRKKQVKEKQEYTSPTPPAPQSKTKPYIWYCIAAAALIFLMYQHSSDRARMKEFENALKETPTPIVIVTQAPTPTPTSTPTPTPTSTPTPTPTPAPTPKTPSADDLRGQDGVTYPSGGWLSEYQKKYIKGTTSGNAYLRYSPSKEGREYQRYVAEGEQVTVLAYEDGYGLVKTTDGRAGWVTSKFLVDRY